jgi:hypothetical protein
MFGYRIEGDFDIGKEQRRNRLMWVNGGAIGLLCLLYVIHPFSAAIFQGYFLTSLCYGDSFYVRRRDDLRKPWLWKAIFATIPLHLLLLLAIVWLDQVFPNVFPKVVVSAPILFVTFGVEAVLFDQIVARCNPPEAPQPMDASPV